MNDKKRREGDPGVADRRGFAPDAKRAGFAPDSAKRKAAGESAKRGFTGEGAKRGFAGEGARRKAAASVSGEISEDARRFAATVKPLDSPCGAADAPLPELLLPAGSPLALEAAIEAGADAVYFGARAFSARARAENFADGEIADALRLCRAYGVRAYAAVNTRLRDGELGDAMRLVGLLADAGVDALIVADLGLCALIRREFGGALELHASTQLTPTSAWDARALFELGFSRMVAPRELSLGALRRLCEDSPIEIEAFIHGAHCVSLSGQCLMSSLIGGRSANRGECAQPCRMAYGCEKERGALLSLCDMCYAPDVPAMISTGVRSLKVEGRQKDAAYVYGVGRVYRRLLDERRAATPDEICELAALFERGFTDGYLRGDYRDMRGTRRDDAPSGAPFGGLRRRVALDGSLTLRAGEAPTLTLRSPIHSATVSLGEAAPAAEGDALTEARAKAQIARLGGTPFELAGFAFDSDGASWLSAAALNELRRTAVAELTASARVERVQGTVSPAEVKGEEPLRVEGSALATAAPQRIMPSHKISRTAEFTALSQIPPEAFAYFDAIYLPYGEFGEAARKAGAHLSLPPYMTDEIADRIAALIRPGDRVLAHTLGQIYFARSLGAIADLSLRQNVWNAECARSLAGLSPGGVITVSPELPAAAMRDISGEVVGALAVAYGKLPVMYTARCAIRGHVKCKGGAGGVTGALRESEPCRAYISDRTGARFFALGGRDCATVIFNSVPTWTADRRIAGCGEHYVFSDESAGDAAEVIAAYVRGDAPRGAVRRVR